MVFGPNEEVLRALDDAMHNSLSPDLLRREDIAAVLDALPEVAAYEILDKSGDGAVVYRDWP